MGWGNRSRSYSRTLPEEGTPRRHGGTEDDGTEDGRRRERMWDGRRPTEDRRRTFPDTQEITEEPFTERRRPPAVSVPGRAGPHASAREAAVMSKWLALQTAAPSRTRIACGDS